MISISAILVKMNASYTKGCREDPVLYLLPARLEEERDPREELYLIKEERTKSLKTE